MTIKPFLLFAFITTLAAPAWSNTCDTSTRAASTPTENFTDNGDGTVTDKQSGLTWMRCAQGQTWSGGGCAGSAQRYTWPDALAMALNLNALGGHAQHADWRIPKLPELAGIVERQCRDPRINLALFPATPAAAFWSATSRRGEDDQALALSFGPEGVSAGSKEETHFVRLVRGGKSAPKAAPQ
jgi:hypothetical protein